MTWPFKEIEHNLHQELAERLFGWKWLSFIGTPVRGTEGYPKHCRVRHFFSPEALNSKKWQEYLQEHDVQPATGEEPLAYRYCSSAGPACPPTFYILVHECDLPEVQAMTPAIVEPTDTQIESACMSFHHGFGLMDKEDQDKMRRKARDWLRAWQKEGLKFPQPDKK